MTFLGLERPVAYGSRLIFDPTMANLVLLAQGDYIKSARYAYLQGVQEMKDFQKTYGDFTSPIQKDMDWYNLNVTGKVRDAINTLYANGIDPLRSAEGRAAISLLIYSMPIGDIAMLRQSAETAKEYVKNRGILEREGKYDADLNERFLKYDLNNFDTLGGGLVWNITSPLLAQSLKELTEKAFNNRTAHELTKEDVLSFGPEWALKYDPRAKYTGFTKNDVKQIADKIAPGLYGTPYYDYYRDLAKQKVIAAGYMPTEKNINDQLANDIANTQEEWMIKPTGTLSEWILMENLKTSRAAHNLAKKQYDETHPETKIGFTDIVKGAIQRQLSGISNKSSNGNSKYRVVSGKEVNDAMANYMNHTVKITGFGLNELRNMFYGYNDKAEESFDVVDGRKRKRITFTPQSGLHPTMARAYDYKGLSHQGRTKAFDEYLSRNKVYGYPLEEDFSISWDKTHNTNVFDVNQYVEIKASQIEGFFKQRYKAVTKKDDFGSSDYAQFKRKAMAALGISKLPNVSQKQTVAKDNSESGQMQFTPTYEEYVLVPVTRSHTLPGLEQSEIDTHVDKNIVTGKELLNNQEQYQIRDIKRMK